MSLPSVFPGYQEQTSGPQPWDQIDNRHRVLDDPPGEQTTKEEAYDRENAYALPVNQRSARHWSGHTFLVSESTATSILPAQKGRKSFTILVPTTAPAAVWIDQTEATLELANPMGFYLAVGASITVETEGGVSAISATVGTDTIVCVTTTWG